jgi:hypothetical protein
MPSQLSLLVPLAIFTAVLFLADNSTWYFTVKQSRLLVWCWVALVAAIICFDAVFRTNYPPEKVVAALASAGGFCIAGQIAVWMYESD